MFEPLEKSAWTPGAAAHLLARAGFGGSPEEVEALHARGVEDAVDSLLEVPEESDLFPPPSASVPRDLVEFRKQLQGKSEEEKKALQTKARKEDQQQLAELRTWWLNRMRWSPFAAREKAVLFWHGHWATSAEKVKEPFAMWQQNETLRAYALGKFEPMAAGISRDPAMMRYLDLAQSKRESPNENFARELMELFTLGEGHYTEDDIREAARAFTGYRINPTNQRFLLAQRQQDTGVKNFFGLEGQFSGDDIIGFLTADPQCARFLSRKIWTFYAAENPSPELVEALAESYRTSGLDTGRLLRTIFRSREFYSGSVVRKQIKSPVQWLVQSAKELEIGLPGDAAGMLRQLGQTLFAPPNVKGWDGGRAWISSSSLLLRYNLAGKIIDQKAVNPDKILSPALDPQASSRAIGQRLFQFAMDEALQKKFQTFLSTHPPGREMRRDLIHLMMSTPDYQLT